jgi:hypothetical protein
MPESDKEMDKGGFASAGAANGAPSAIVSDIFQRVAQLGGLMVVAYVAPVSGGGLGSPRAQKALINIANEAAAEREASMAASTDAKATLLTRKAL